MPSPMKKFQQAAVMDLPEAPRALARTERKASTRKPTKQPHAFQAEHFQPEHMAQMNGLLMATLREVHAQHVVVDIAALGLQQLTAKSLAGLSDADIGRDVVLGFEAGDPARPIVLGAMLGSAWQANLMPHQVSTQARVQPAEALVDGERVVLKAEHEIELRCGEAAIVLMADGRIQLRGTYITSQASATQRILGGAVHVN
jgi:hypothetical protein